MALEKYIEKRNFKHTSEPSSSKSDNSGGLKFVIQRHDATNLHYDFRLEMEGVLKSWAVPKGPSLNPHDKRLAMFVEDHPFEYRTFEGTIPEGNYGAGIVEIWDEGTFHSLETTDRNESEKIMLAQLEQGSLKFVLQGNKLNGEFALVKIKNSDSPKDNAWLLIKHKDEYAWDDDYNSEDHVSADSKILKEEPFDSKDFIFEIKLDGYRAVAEVQNGEVELYSRNGLSFNHKFAPIVAELKSIKHNVVLDGEVVILNEEGVTSFQLLQQYEEAPSPNLYFYVFDIIHLNGFDVTGLPLLDRKKILKEMLPSLPHIKYTDHIEAEGKMFFELAKKNGLEGIMAKKIDSPYRIGVRATEWLKIKIVKRQEAIICGFTAPRGSRNNFGAIILGVYKGGKLISVGHSGSGFTENSLSELMELMKPLIQNSSPFDSKIKTNEKPTWVKPELVCEIAFTEWTDEGNMRHPIFLGLRPDKEAKQVQKEVEKPFDNEPNEKIIKPMEKDNLVTALEFPDYEGIVNTEEVIEGHKLKLTHLDKIYWPDEKYTKGNLINYYHRISKWILPYLKDRPESLNRHPNGILEDNFFQKDMGENLPNWIESQEIFSESTNKNINYLVCQNEATLIYMSNLGCIEINPWNSRIGSLENPDFTVIDLDPGENTFEEVIEAALVVKEMLDKAGAEAYCKTSGSSGMHIFVPLGAKYDYEESKNFAHIIATLVHDQLPKLTSLERSPKARRKQIYLDYLQNRTGQTLASVYSVRPKPGATVSTPLEWSEVKPGLHPSQFTFKNIFERLEKKGDLFSGILGKGIDMQKCLKNLGA